MTANAPALIDELAAGLHATAAAVVPWFLDQMPAAYFQDTDHETRMSHMRAIIAARASGLPLQMTLRSADSHRWTFLNERDEPGLLARLVAQLPADQPLRAAKVHGTADGKLVLDTFEFGVRQRFDPSDVAQRAIRDVLVAHAKEEGMGVRAEVIDAQLGRSAASYVATVTPLRFFRHLAVLRDVGSSDDVVAWLEREEVGTGLHRIMVAAGNATPRRLFERIASHLGTLGIDVRRAYLDVFEADGGGVSLLSYVVHGPAGALEPGDPLWRRLSSELRRIKWVDDLAIELAAKHVELGLLRAEVIHAIALLAHQVLTWENPYAFARDRILQLAERYLPASRSVADLFLDRFDPTGALDDASFAAKATEAAEAIERDVDPPDARRLLATMLDIVEGTFRTNAHLQGRYALALRIDPALLERPAHDETPFGVFFVCGRNFDGFHVRFRDIARGGVRVVRPVGPEQHAIESERHYDEVYGLAYAQQLKNKDIPEGGAKAVVLVSPDASVDRSVKAFTDGLLDLITADEAVRAKLVDRFGATELLYLGPDENISAEMIEWVVARAAERGYAMPNAFMSSKPGAGINHKVYGVTSEGVTVFLEAALGFVGIDPRKQAFTVKLTGGPDGDVAGNEIKILAREFGANAKVVGIADGSGCAEDPNGLPMAELLRLVDRSAPVAALDRKTLGASGSVTAVDEPGGVKARNTMHNRVVADAFVPAGGRPETIHSGNWQAYLQADGTPSSKVIVEGANLFITLQARQCLGEAGAVIVKDSSANKCGVICSSFEIVASMLLDEQTFMATKERFVAEVLEKLRGLARREAQLLFAERRRNPDVLVPELSVRLSRVMNRASDAIEASFGALADSDAELARDLVRSHLPTSLVELVGDRLFDDLPAGYLSRTVACSLAGVIVYREGLDFLERLSRDAIGELAPRYLRAERQTSRLLTEIEASDLPSKSQIADLLARAGTRAGLGSA